MTNMFLKIGNSWLDNVGNVIICGIIALFIALIIVILAKNETMKTVLLIILGVLIIISGCICGVKCYREITAESYVSGSINIKNNFIADTFEYNVSSFDLHKDNESEEDLYSNYAYCQKVEGFKGTTKKYKVIFNDYTLSDEDVKITAGSVAFNLTFNFTGVESEELNTPTISVLVKFLNNKTTLDVACVGKTEASYMQQYFTDYGFRLAIKEIV